MGVGVTLAVLIAAVAVGVAFKFRDRIARLVRRSNIERRGMVSTKLTDLEHVDFEE